MLNLQLTVAENIEFFRAIVPNQRSITNQEIIEQLGLHHLASIKAGQLSAGQRKKLALAYLILSAAKLWLLDEPYAALDTVAQQWLTGLLQQHVAAGGMIILTAHQPIEWITTATYTLIECKEVNAWS
jgi:heme exporter protein A